MEDVYSKKKFIQNVYIDRQRKEFSGRIYDNEESIATRDSDGGEFITTRDLRKEFFGDIYNSLNG